MTMSMYAPTLKYAVERLRAEFPNLAVVVGGYAFDFAPELGIASGVEHHGTDAATLVSMAERLLGIAA